MVGRPAAQDAPQLGAKIRALRRRDNMSQAVYINNLATHRRSCEPLLGLLSGVK